MKASPHESLLHSSQSESSKATRVIKLYLQTELSAIYGAGHYKSFLINSMETFYSLKLKTIDKINMKRADLPFSEILIHFHYPTYRLQQRGPLCPSDDESIIALLEKEELFHEGELVLVFGDIRINNSSNYSMNRFDPLLASPLAPPPQLDLCTEFNQGYLEGLYETIPAVLLGEIENISLKIGRLQILHSGKDPWR